MSEETMARTAGDVAADLVEWLAARLDQSRDSIALDQPVTSLGLDSIKLTELDVLLEENYGLSVSVEELFDGLTVADLTAKVVASEQEPDPFSRDDHYYAVAASADLGHALRTRQARMHRPGGVLDKVREFDLPERLRTADLLPFYTELSSNEGATCTYRGRSLIMLGSNNYLGLTADTRVRHAAAEAARVDGPSLTGSRLLNGSTTAHSALERQIAEFLGRPDALVFATGYQANVALLSALLTESSALVADDECHASIYDGAAVARADVVQFRHNSPDDLDRRLAALRARPALVMVDGVYSMSGDLARLAELRDVCDRYQVPLAVDDAHGLGMVGATGRGIEEAAGVVAGAHMLTGTFSKSLASVGGWIAGDRDLVEWVRYHGRSGLFSAAIPPPALAAAAAALDILRAEPDRIVRLHENAAYWRTGLAGLGFDVGQTATAIVPVTIGDEMLCLRLARALLDGGVYANCVVAPAVAAGRAMIRTSVTAIHETHHLDRALAVFAAAGRTLGIIE